MSRDDGQGAGTPDTPLVSPSVWGCSGELQEAKTGKNKAVLRIYGFEGEAGQEGEGVTRIYESSHRRAEIYI